MRSHPAVRNAAVALLRGWDPVAYASLDDVDRMFADAVLEEAHQRWVQEQEDQAQRIASHTIARLAESMKK